MRRLVLLAEDAARDIEDIYRFVEAREGRERADHVLAALEREIGSLDRLAARGNIPKELDALGIDEFREFHWKPYRVIYRVGGREAVVYCVLDGRRDMQALLQRRLMR
ncbi:MAG: type II toxin-antitoxin system RelE/ParE family toxin [Alphaproteobacteria bacterium]|nr:type II toxin-antitoxin system RelE/ParE family toxin [Alphaproteobacteria bacterium]